MANRHLSRGIVLQVLFELDFRDKSYEEALGIFDRDVAEFGKDLSDDIFMKTLLLGVLEKQKDLDNIITKAAPDWPIEKISIVDRNILRIGLYELLFADREEVPPKVAINEAIELAKTYGSETSSRFVNGVVGAVYKEMGEPGKNDKPKKKIKNIPDNEAPIDNLYGAVVYAEHEGEIYLALVHDVFGKWTLSKGHPEKDENSELAIKRITAEEIGVEVEVSELLGNNEYIAYDPEKGKLRKRVEYFLAKGEYKELIMPESGGLDDAKWFKLADILDLNFYDDILPLVTKAVKILLKSPE